LSVPDTQSGQRTFLDQLQAIDRRYIYIAVAILVSLPFLIRFTFPTVPTAPAKGLYDKIQSLKPGAVVLLSSDWGPDIMAECRPQARAVIEHVMRQRLRLGILSPLPEGVGLIQQVAQELARKYHYVYGKDWINFGFRPSYDLMVMSMVKNVPGTLANDYQGKPLSRFQFMAGIRTIRDVSLCVDITGSVSYGTWINWVYGQYRIPLGIGVTGVMVPTVFPYYDSGQFVGLLAGMKGAAEYETLLHHPGDGVQMMQSQNAAHLLILLLILVGNVGYLLHQRAQRRT
jgi:hypothetical protein